MGVAHVGLAHRDPCGYNVKGFRTISFIERNVSIKRHLQRVRHFMGLFFMLDGSIGCGECGGVGR